MYRIALKEKGLENKLGYYKHLSSICMLYVTVKLMTIILIYKIIAVGPFFVSASTLLIPFWFFIGDVITEVYGYKVGRHVIWVAIICQIFFACIVTVFAHVGESTYWSVSGSSISPLGGVLRASFASSLSIVFGAFLNAYLLSKLKILLSGKYFFYRSIISSFFGEICFTLLAFFIEFANVVPLSNILSLVAASLVVKIFCNFILAVPAQLIVDALKKSEGLEIYDHNTDFNPFVFNIKA